MNIAISFNEFLKKIFHETILQFFIAKQEEDEAESGDDQMTG
jgi:hypothetical protein